MKVIAVLAVLSAATLGLTAPAMAVDGLAVNTPYIFKAGSSSIPSVSVTGTGTALTNGSSVTALSSVPAVATIAASAVVTTGTATFAITGVGVGTTVITFTSGSRTTTTTVTLGAEILSVTYNSQSSSYPASPTLNNFAIGSSKDIVISTASTGDVTLANSDSSKISSASTATISGGKATFRVKALALGSSDLTFSLPDSTTRVVSLFVKPTLFPSTGFGFDIAQGQSIQSTFSSPESGALPSDTVLSIVSNSQPSKVSAVVDNFEKVTFTGGGTSGASQIQVSAPGYMPLTLIVKNIAAADWVKSCSLVSDVKPCVSSATVVTSGVSNSSYSVTDLSTVRVAFETTGPQVGALRYPAITIADPNSVSSATVSINFGSARTIAGYFGVAVGNVTTFSQTTTGDQILTVGLEPVSFSTMQVRPGSDEAPSCAVGAPDECPSDIRARKTMAVGGIKLFPVGVAGVPGAGTIPLSLANGWMATNANQFSLDSLSGKLSFKYAGPHFTATGSLNEGFYKTFIPADALTEIFGLPNTTSSEFRSLLGVSDLITGASSTTSSPVRDVTGSSSAGGILVDVGPIYFSEHKMELTTAARTSTPATTSPVSGGSSAQTPSTTVITTSPQTSTAVVPAVTSGAVSSIAPSRNPLNSNPLTSTVVLVSASEANSAPVRSMSNPPSALITKAPVVNSTAAKIVSLTTQGLEPGTNYEVKLKVNGKYVNLGEVKTDSSGKVSLPAFKPSAPGTYIVAVVNPVTGKTGYVKVTVPPKRK